jgi:hypothetical protein
MTFNVTDIPTGIYDLAALCYEVEMTADPDELIRLSAIRNEKINEVLDAGVSVDAMVKATGLYRSTIILVRHPERFPEMKQKAHLTPIR